jgi:hypothetical protein
MGDERNRGYPLTWPIGVPRTPASSRTRAKFKVHFSRARSDLIDELARLGAHGTCFSSNVPRRADGTPYAEDRLLVDPGVAVYFTRHDQEMAIACDRYTLVKDNLRAVGLTIEAIRAIERNGSSHLMEQAFRGFLALPPATVLDPAWWTVLGVDEFAPLAQVEAAYLELAQQHHPDKPEGDHERMALLNRARDRARRERNIT